MKAYAMRIIDWSSDVCSSDLCVPFRLGFGSVVASASGAILVSVCLDVLNDALRPRTHRETGIVQRQYDALKSFFAPLCVDIGFCVVPHVRRDRKRVVWGNSVSFGLERGGRRIIKKNKN